MTTTLTPQVPANQASSTSDDENVWQRVWQHRKTNTQDDAWLQREEDSPRWQLIERELKLRFGSLHGLKTIELGAGRGDLSVLLARRGADVALLDYTEEALTQAKHRFDRLRLNAYLVRDDFMNPQESWRNRFDLVLSSGVIEHFVAARRDDALRAHMNALTPGGLAFVSVPHAACWPYRAWKLYLESRGWWPYGQEIPYSRAEMVRRAERVGFVDVDTYCTGFWQSVADHWLRGVFKRDVDWTQCRSRFDEKMGLNLLMIARKPVGDTRARRLVPRPARLLDGILAGANG